MLGIDGSSKQHLRHMMRVLRVFESDRKGTRWQNVRCLPIHSYLANAIDSDERSNWNGDGMEYLGRCSVQAMFYTSNSAKDSVTTLFE